MRKTRPKLEGSQGGRAERQKKQETWNCALYKIYSETFWASALWQGGWLSGLDGRDRKSVYSLRERGQSKATLIEKKKKWSVYACDQRRGKNVPANRSFQQERHLCPFRNSGDLWPGDCFSWIFGFESYHHRVPGLVSEETSSCFRHWVIRYTQGNIPIAIKPWVST